MLLRIRSFRSLFKMRKEMGARPCAAPEIYCPNAYGPWSFRIALTSPREPGRIATIVGVLRTETFKLAYSIGRHDVLKVAQSHPGAVHRAVKHSGRI